MNDNQTTVQDSNYSKQRGKYIYWGKNLPFPRGIDFLDANEPSRN